LNDHLNSFFDLQLLSILCGFPHITIQLWKLYSMINYKMMMLKKYDSSI